MAPRSRPVNSAQLSLFDFPAPNSGPAEVAEPALPRTLSPEDERAANMSQRDLDLWIWPKERAEAWLARSHGPRELLDDYVLQIKRDSAALVADPSNSDLYERRLAWFRPAAKALAETLGV